MKSVYSVCLVAALACAALVARAYEVVEAYDEVVFVLGPAATPDPSDPDPRPGTVVWDVGVDATAFVQDAVLYVRGSGTVTNAPWASMAGTVEEVKIAEDVTSIPDGSLEGMDNLTHVNGMAVSVFNNVSAGVVKAGGFKSIAIDPSTRTGTVTFRVKSAASVDAPVDDWVPIEATGTAVDSGDSTAICVPISAESPAGFFKVVTD